ncbi:MAG: arginine--tRNA ligase, partial [Deltaproteobacteria bacterium]
MRSQLREILARAVEKTAKAEGLDSGELPPIVLEPPKQREFGDLSSNVAMVWARRAKKPPRAIAEAVLRNLQDPDGILARQEIAGPGFLNFSFAPKFFYREFRALVSGRNLQIDFGHGEKIQVEFASVNPTGPLHVGHGRVAVIGDVLARLH